MEKTFRIWIQIKISKSIKITYLAYFADADLSTLKLIVEKGNVKIKLDSKDCHAWKIKGKLNINYKHDNCLSKLKLFLATRLYR